MKPKTQRLPLPRLGDRRVQRRHAVRPVRHAADRRRPAARRRGDDPSRSSPAWASSGSGPSTTRTPRREQAIAEELDDRVDTLTRGFLGLTVSCARCHDHKFDPIPTQDYYSLAGIFNGTEPDAAPRSSPPAESKAYDDAQARREGGGGRASNALLGDAGEGGRRSGRGRTRPSTSTPPARFAGRRRSRSRRLAKAEGLEPLLPRPLGEVPRPGERGQGAAAFKDWFALKADASPTTSRRPRSRCRRSWSRSMPDARRRRRQDERECRPRSRRRCSRTRRAAVRAAGRRREAVRDRRRTSRSSRRCGPSSRRARRPSPPAPLTAHVLSGRRQRHEGLHPRQPGTKGEDGAEGLPASAGVGRRAGRRDYTPARPGRTRSPRRTTR